MSQFGGDLNPIRDGYHCCLLVWRVVSIKTLKFRLTFLSYGGGGGGRGIFEPQEFFFVIKFFV